MTHEIELSGRRERAALLVADDQLTDERIAEEIGIGRKTLHRWKMEPAFLERVGAIRQEMAERIKNEGLRRKENRIAALEETHALLMRVRQARAEDPFLVNHPGGETGLLTQVVAPGGRAYSVAIDPTPLKEEREYLKLIAQETGQLEEKPQNPILTITLAIDRRASESDD